ncbi:MAG: glycosyltransferase family 4 protein [bacterium]|nr:glycosyltransferase family 4 protein [bacterium]
MKNNISGKNVWLFNHYAKTPDLAGGSRHYAISKILTAMEYQITIFASAYNPHKNEDAKCPEEKDYTIEIKDGVRFVWLKTFPYKKNNWRRVFNMLSYSRKCSRIYSELLKKEKIEPPDTVIGSSVHLFAVWTGFRAAKKLNANFVMEVRDLWPMTLVEFRKSLKFHPIVFFFGMLERFLAKRAHKIVSVLPQAGEYYKRMGHEKKVVWIPNGVDTTLYNKQKITAENGKNEKKNHFTVMYTGTFGMEANLPTLLHAAKAIKEKDLPIDFQLVGRGEKKQELEELTNTLQLQNVRFRDPVIKEQIPSLLASADALWIGTRKVKNLYKYGYSFNKLFEYLAAGKPILFSIDCRYNPVNEAGAGLTVPPGEPAALADAITTIYKMKQPQRIQMGEKGKTYAKDYHDMEKLAAKFHQLLSEFEDN